jgi:DNA repair ATPase RecN
LKIINIAMRRTFFVIALLVSIQLYIVSQTSELQNNVSGINEGNDSLSVGSQAGSSDSLSYDSTTVDTTFSIDTITTEIDSVQTAADTTLVPDSMNIEPLSNQKATNMVELKNYVRPVKDLISFYEMSFIEMSDKIQKWNIRVNDSIQKANEIDNEIEETEKTLFDLKNADSKKYSSNIISLKGKLDIYREQLKKLKTNMFTDGTNILKEIKVVSESVSASTNSKINEVNKAVKSADCNPSKGEISESIVLKDLEINTDIVSFIFPCTEMLYFDLNDIKALSEACEKWNTKISEVIANYSANDQELTQTESDLKIYKSDPKKYKTEIASYKKKCASLEKTKKQLAGKMKNNCKEVTDYLKTSSAEKKITLKERFKDISDNINYMYLEKLNL